MGRQNSAKELVKRSEPIDAGGVLQMALEIKERLIVCRNMARYGGMDLLAHLLDLALAEIADRIGRSAAPDRDGS